MADRYLTQKLKKLRKRTLNPWARKDLNDLIDYCEALEAGEKALEERTETEFRYIHGVAVVNRKYV